MMLFNTKGYFITELLKYKLLDIVPAMLKLMWKGIYACLKRWDSLEDYPIKQLLLLLLLLLDFKFNPKAISLWKK
jgi:hypothetical protein